MLLRPRKSAPPPYPKLNVGRLSCKIEIGIAHNNIFLNIKNNCDIIFVFFYKNQYIFNIRDVSLKDKEDHAYVLEQGVDLGVGWASQSVADWMSSAGTSLVQRPPLLTQTGIDHLRTSLPDDVKAKIPAETLAILRPNDPVPKAAYIYECYVIGSEILKKPSVEACIAINLQAQY